MSLKNLQVETTTGALSLAVPAATGVTSITGVTGIAGTVTAGKLVTLSSGTPPAGVVADNTASKADGYVIDEATGTIGLSGIIVGILTSATAGTEYFLGTAGGVATSAGGTVVQSVGYAVNETDMLFIAGRPPL
jgi:hypothetical protein